MELPIWYSSSAFSVLLINSLFSPIRLFFMSSNLIVNKSYFFLVNDATCLDFDPDGDFIATMSSDLVCLVSNVSTGSCRFYLPISRKTNNCNFDFCGIF